MFILRKSSIVYIHFVTLMNNLKFIYYHRNVQCALSLTECTTAYSSFTCNRPYVLEGCCFQGDSSREIVFRGKVFSRHPWGAWGRQSSGVICI